MVGKKLTASSKGFDNPSSSGIDPSVPQKKPKLNKDDNPELHIAFKVWLYRTLEEVPKNGPILQVRKEYIDVFNELKPLFPVLKTC